MRETLELVATVFLIVGLTVALAGGDRFSPLERPVGDRVTEGFPRTVFDDFDQPVVLPSPPTRIASVTLASDEILLDMIPPERLAACTYFARDPSVSACAEKAEAVAQTISADVERIVALEPDLVIVAAFTSAAKTELMRAAGLNVFRIGNYDQIEDIRAMIVSMGRLTGAEDEAWRLVRQVDEQLEAIRQKVRGRRKPTVLHYSPDGFVPGKGTLFDELLDVAGGVNAAALAGVEGFQRLSTELAIALDPEVIVMPGVFSSAAEEMQDPRDFLESQPAWRQSKAVRNGRVYIVPARMGSLSHHIVEAADELAELLHPAASE